MTPPAVTATGRGSGVSGGRAASAAPGHRRALRHQPAPSRPRRISGPLRGRAAVAPATARPAPAARALGLIRSLPEHSLLDRLVRGRAWIPVLGVMLAGIVTMQVEVLKLGTSVGRWMQRASTLQTKNDALQASVASLADDQRIERLAAGTGMVMPAPTAVSFLRAEESGAISRALSNIHAPDPTGFITSLPLIANPASSGTQGTTTATIGPSSTGSASATSATAPTTTGAPTTTATTASAAAATAASGAPAPNNGPTAPASAPATQTPATGAAAVAPSSIGTSTTPIGG